MEAVEYLRQKNRMTKVCKDGYCTIACSGCPLNEPSCTCYELEKLNPEKAIAIVEKWFKEHPLKTYAQDFLEKFPNASTDYDGTPTSCKRYIYGGRCKGDCLVCWNSQMEET